MAWAVSCMLDSNNHRPVFGLINYNQFYFSQSNLTNDKTFSLDLATTIHEMTHVLGFSSSMIDYWIDPATLEPYKYLPIINTTMRGKPMTLLNTSNVLAVAKEHYGCQSIEGM